MAIKYLDLISGNDANDGSSWANAKKTFSAVDTVASAGDEIRIAKSASPSSCSINATFTQNSATVTLASALTQTIDLGGAWTSNQGANVVCSNDTSNKLVSTSGAKTVINAAATTGVLCYKDISTLDLSGYQQISLGIYVGAGSDVTAGYLRLDLCSDNAGATPVNSFTLPLLSYGQWTILTLDSGGALGNAIESIALYMVTDFTLTAGITISDLIACKQKGAADSLCLNSLISTSSSAFDNTKPLMAIKSIDGTAVTLWQKWFPATETSVTLYQTNPILWHRDLGLALANYGSCWTMNKDYDITGGYNTSTGSRDGYTIVDIQNNNTTVFVDSNASQSTRTFSYLGFLRYYAIYYCYNTATASQIIYDYCLFMQTQTSGSYLLNLSSVKFDYATIQNCYIEYFGAFIGASSAYLNRLTIKDTVINTMTYFIAASAQTGIGFATALFELVIDNVDIKYDITQFYAYGQWIYIDDLQYSGTSAALLMSGIIGAFISNSAIYQLNTTGYDNIYLYNTTIAASTEVTATSFSTSTPTVYSAKHDGTADNHILFAGGFKILSETSVRNTASGYAWKFVATTTNYASNPYSYWLGQFAVAGSGQVTASIYARRSHTGASIKLRVLANDMIGLASDVTAEISAAADTWEQLTCQFTPTAAGAVLIIVEFYTNNAARYGYIDDFSISQA